MTAPSLNSENKIDNIISERNELMQEMNNSPRTMFFLQHYEKLWKESQDKLTRAYAYRDMCETLRVRDSVLKRFIVGTYDYKNADDEMCALLHSKAYRVEEKRDWPKYFEGRDMTNYEIYNYFRA